MIPDVLTRVISVYCIRRKVYFPMQNWVKKIYIYNYNFDFSLRAFSTGIWKLIESYFTNFLIAIPKNLLYTTKKLTYLNILCQIYSKFWKISIYHADYWRWSIWFRKQVETTVRVEMVRIKTDRRQQFAARVPSNKWSNQLFKSITDISSYFSEQFRFVSRNA